RYDHRGARRAGGHQRQCAPDARHGRYGRHPGRHGHRPAGARHGSMARGGGGRLAAWTGRGRVRAWTHRRRPAGAAAWGAGGVGRAISARGRRSVPRIGIVRPRVPEAARHVVRTWRRRRVLPRRVAALVVVGTAVRRRHPGALVDAIAAPVVGGFAIGAAGGGRDGQGGRQQGCAFHVHLLFRRHITGPP